MPQFNESIHKVVSKVEDLQKDHDFLVEKAKNLQKEIDTILKTCKHHWSLVEYRPSSQDIYSEGFGTKNFTSVFYTIPEIWERKCYTCGVIQTTSRKKSVPHALGLTKEEPDWN